MINKENGGVFALGVIAVLTAMLFGGVTALGSYRLIIGLLALLSAVVLLRSLPVLSYSVLAASLLVSGSLEIFFGISQANWLASLLALALFVAVCFAPKPDKLKAPLFINRLMGMGFALYVLTLIFSTMVNFANVSQLVVGLRTLIPFLAVFYVVALGYLQEQTLQRHTRLILIIGCLQWLFCIAQQLIVVPKRYGMGAVGGDAEAIVGSFGGNPLGGGYTGEMACFTVMVLFVVYFLVEHQQLNRRWLWCAVISALVSIGLAETKIVIVLTPLLLIGVLWQVPGGINRGQLKMLALFGFALIVIVAIYSQRFWQADGEVLHAFTYSFDPNFKIDPLHRGRFANLEYWFDQTKTSMPLLYSFIGFGPGATLESSFLAGAGSAVLQYGPGIDNTAFSILLWNCGLLGTLGFTLLTLGAFFEASRISRLAHVTSWVRWLMVGLKAWVLVFLAMLPYQPAMVAGVSMQYLFWFSLGLIVYYGRRSTLVGFK